MAILSKSQLAALLSGTGLRPVKSGISTFFTDLIDTTTPNQTSTALTSAASIDIDASNLGKASFTLTSALTAITFTYTGIGDNSEVDLLVNKTTATNAVYAFPANTYIMVDGVLVVGTSATLASATTTGKWFINIKRVGTEYFVKINKFLA